MPPVSCLLIIFIAIPTDTNGVSLLPNTAPSPIHHADLTPENPWSPFPNRVMFAHAWHEFMEYKHQKVKSTKALIFCLLLPSPAVVPLTTFHGRMQSKCMRQLTLYMRDMSVGRGSISNILAHCPQNHQNGWWCGMNYAITICVSCSMSNWHQGNLRIILIIRRIKFFIAKGDRII